MKAPLLVALLLVSYSTMAQDAEGFVLVKSEPPIEVHERWVEFPGKKPAVTSRELKTEFVVNTTIPKLLALIRDETRVKSWQEHVRDYKIYPKSDTTMWEEYSCHDIPWPLDDQDSFMEYKLNEVIPGKEYLVCFKSKVDKKVAPLYEKVNRIELVGSWKFVAVSPTTVNVTYRIQSAPATSLPRMIIDPVVRNNLITTVKSLTVIAEK